MKFLRKCIEAWFNKPECSRCGDTREVEGGTMPGAIRCPECAPKDGAL